MRDAASSAAWRKPNNRHTTSSFLRFMAQNKVVRSPLFRLPSFTMECIAIDALRACCLGVSQDVLGNLFWECWGSIFKDKKREDQVKSPVGSDQGLVPSQRPPTKLQILTPEMVRVVAKPPKLRANGGETRYLVPFAAELAQELQGALCRRRQHVLACQAEAAHLPRAQRVSDVDHWQPPAIFGATQMSLLLGSSRKSHVRAGVKTMCPRHRCALCKGTKP